MTVVTMPIEALIIPSAMTFRSGGIPTRISPAECDVHGHSRIPFYRIVITKAQLVLRHALLVGGGGRFLHVAKPTDARSIA
ncbi:hypothetical protein GQF42_00510 [Streptomyces broussonetiae]|uniref:Uncharacterized protein n=1 Tax=Streptomyces broussonetiae TaxID=2686304 RepID=A0A6I6MUR7_9ACTN|nr:hypothetical protein [Streptomyces broussonetiae]QHA02049.1 hypothetical protein GQF42_00510 [Streptomyces broussonetiae]